MADTQILSSSKRRGYLLLDSHPIGSETSVHRLWSEIGDRDQATDRERPVVLVLGSSAGYGLASALTAIGLHRADGIGVCFERPATRKRSATAGWYRTRALADIASDQGTDWSFINGDAFDSDVKNEVAGLIKERWGGVDYLIYSIAAPRRRDPETGEVHSSVLKTRYEPFETPTIAFDGDNCPYVRSACIEAATEAETQATVKVMGGGDWADWVTLLAERDLLRDGFTTAALTYVGSHLTAPVYRDGTIGAAKEHLEATSRTLDEQLEPRGARALTVVFGAAVTQASTAIPGISLYTSLLADVLGEQMVMPIDQAEAMWRHITDSELRKLDEHNRVRLDGWELDPTVQHEIEARFSRLTSNDLGDLQGITWFDQQVLQLYGFAVPGVDYDRPVELDLPWPTS
jgi:enoyl-[acyl-carrier protein] reductase/trans-2-enoyl-CoA reductase (NAD+)